MIKGVTIEEHKIIKNILLPYKDVYVFFYYGSRVKGNFSKVSDLDILIKGQKTFDDDELEILKSKFDKSSLPYIVNLTDFQRINDTFYKNIENDLVEI